MCKKDLFTQQIFWASKYQVLFLGAEDTAYETGKILGLVKLKEDILVEKERHNNQKNKILLDDKR